MQKGRVEPYLSGERVVGWTCGGSEKRKDVSGERARKEERRCWG